MKKYLWAALLLYAGSVCSQTQVGYGYSPGGNRISRFVVQLRMGDTSQVQPGEGWIGSKKLTVYPNPTKGVLGLQFSDVQTSDVISMTLYDLQGKVLVSRQQLSAQGELVDLSAQPTGIYIMKVTINNAASEWKIVKE